MISKIFQGCSDAFSDESSTAYQEHTAGEKALVMLYGGKHEDNLNILSYWKLCEKTAVKTTRLQSEVLPPILVAAKYHSFRAYLQIQQWKGSNTMKPIVWGWEMSGGHLMPVLTYQQAAPDGLLRVIHCGCNGDCSNVRCTCRKNNMECSSACTHCRGTSCSNCTVVESESDDEVDDV